MAVKAIDWSDASFGAQVTLSVMYGSPVHVEFTVACDVAGCAELWHVESTTLTAAVEGLRMENWLLEGNSYGYGAWVCPTCAKTGRGLA